MRFYRLLLRLYPAWFRAEYGEEMCGVFIQRLRQEGAIAVWASILFEIFPNAIAVHADALRQDVLWTLRVLRQSPGFSVTAVVVIALGIGANTATFALLDHTLLRPLPFSDPDRLVMLHDTQLKQGVDRNLTSPPNFLDWRTMSRSFDALGAYVAAPIAVNLSGKGQPIRLDSTFISSEVFRAIGVKPAAGRLLTSDDERVGGPDILLMSHSVALALFGSDNGAVGKTVNLDNVAHTIVGVMPAGFAFPSRDFELWRPLRLTPELLANRSNHILYAVARLNPRVSLAAARAEMNGIATQLQRAYPKDNTDTGIGVIRLRDAISPQSRLMVIVVFAAAVCLLLIACTNLANLFWVRVLARKHEIAVRVALGAARERLVRQFLTESLAIGLIGGVLGFIVAVAALPSLSVLVPANLPIPGEPQMDWRIFLFAVLVTLATSIAFGVGPAFRSGGQIDTNSLRLRSARSGRIDRLREVLVIGEIAGTLVLLIAAGLLVKALWNVQAINPGFQTEGVVMLRTALPSPKYNPPAARRAFYSRVLDQVRAMPGVTSAAYVSYHPMEFFSGRTAVGVPGVIDDPLKAPRAVRHYITPGFFGTLGIPLRLGREIDARDVQDSAQVAVLSESLARRLWPAEDPIGRTIFADGKRSVVGVVADIASRQLENPTDSQIYFPAEQMAMPSYYWPKDLIVQSSGNAMALTPSLRRIIHEVDPDQAVSNVQLLDDVMNAQTAPRRVQLMVLGTFTILAFSLAAIGIHGLLSFAVSTRMQEVGIRMALGADRRNILGIFLRKGIFLAVGGIVVAAPVTYFVVQMLRSLLFGVSPNDPLVYGAAALLALIMTVAGTIRPAIRAAAVDPLVTIRAE